MQCDLRPLAPAQHSARSVPGQHPLQAELIAALSEVTLLAKQGRISPWRRHLISQPIGNWATGKCIRTDSDTQSPIDAERWKEHT